jgi:hypothetical protein
MQHSAKQLAIITLLIISVFTIVQCTSSDNGKKPEQVSTPDVSIEKGHHLVIAAGCNDCHSPKIMTPQGPKLDSTRLYSGHPAGDKLPPINLTALEPGSWLNFSADLTSCVGPWGLTFAANITSDSLTGIGAWSESTFVNTIRTGKHLGHEHGRPIMPPMPWENYKNLSDDDLKSIYAYLQTTIPVNNRVHEPYSPAQVKEMAKSQQEQIAKK